MDEEQEADILCIQEFYQDTTKEFPYLDSFHNNGLQLKSHMAIYSRHPQHIDTNQGQLYLNGEKMNNTCIYSDILIKGDTIRVYNIHLASNWFNQSDYAFIQNPKKEKIKEGIIGITKRMKESYKKRAEQVNVIKKHMDASNHPLIVCALDFFHFHTNFSIKDRSNLKLLLPYLKDKMEIMVTVDSINLTTDEKCILLKQKHRQYVF